jgi:multiple sugar transport system substrate-binding protein
VALARSLLIVGIAAAGLLAVVGSERAASRQARPDRVTVTYWEKWNGDEANAMKRVVDAFNASQDRIFVKFLSISNIADKTLLATSGGNPPDVAGLWSDQVVQFAEANALTDLTDYVRQSGLGERDYIAAYWNEMNYKGRVYAMPTSPGTSAMHVNIDLMPPEHNTPETFPKTLGELDKLVNAISKKEKDGHVKIAAFLPRQGFGGGSWGHLFGGNYLDSKGNPNVNSPENLRAWKWVHSFAERFGVRETQIFQSGFGSYSSPQNPFLSGKMAMYMDGPWFSNFIRLYNPKVRWFAVPMPYPDGRPDLAGYTVLNLNTLMIPRGAHHAKEAFEFVRFVQKQEVMEQLCTDQRCNSPLTNVSEQFFSKHPNKFIRVFDQLARSKQAVGPAKIGVWGQIGREVGDAVDKMDLGLKEPKRALDDAQERLKVAWEKYQSQVLGR